MKSTEHTLTRVRNNQRRHRERRREYIASLEKSLEEAGRTIEELRIDLAASKEELERWRGGMVVVEAVEGPRQDGNGEGEDMCAEVEGNTIEADEGDNMVLEVSRHDAEADEGELMSMEVQANHTKTLGNVQSPDVPSAAFDVQLEVFDDILQTYHLSLSGIQATPALQDNSSLQPSQAPKEAPVKAPIEDTELCPPRGCQFQNPDEAVTEHSLPSKQSYCPYPVDPDLQPLMAPISCTTCPTKGTESTTPCTQAYILIAQQNFRGLDAHTIRSWLYEGFRRGRNRSEGCSVDNKLLFGLLDFISSE
jgi:hypothetical protein